MPKYSSTEDLLKSIGWIKYLPDQGGSVGAGVVAIATAAASKVDEIGSRIDVLKIERVDAMKMLKSECKHATSRIHTFHRTDVIEAAKVAHANEMAKNAPPPPPPPDVEPPKSGKKSPK